MALGILMATFDQSKYRQATAVFKLGLKANSKGVHRTLNRKPKGKGWVQCRNSPTGIMCRPDKVGESIEHFKKAYEIYPDIVALNQIALAYEMVGELEMARQQFLLMKEQAQHEQNSAYLNAAELGLERTK
jgi:tetratricopeptide (TPR) repeat protein